MKKVLFGISALLILIPSFCVAATLRGSDNGTETIGKTEVIKNLYVVGENIQSDATIEKDLVAAGSNVSIDGQIKDDLIAAGATINVNNAVGGSVRVAGSSININNNVGEDLLIAGSTVTISEKSKISDDLLVAGSSVNIGGEVNGNIKAVAEKIEISGKINGDVLIREAREVVIKDGTIIGGKLKYYSPSEATIGSSAKIGSIEYNQTKNQVWNKDYSSMTRFYGLLGLIISVLILILILPKFSQEIIENGHSSIGTSFGIGILALIATPFVAITLLVLGVTVSLGFVLMMLYIIYLILAYTLGAIYLGSLIYKLIQKNSKFIVDWKTALIGVVAIFLFGFIKILGPLFIFLVTILMLGSIIVKTKDILAAQRN